MPTGYTATIYDNEDATMKDFIMSCARNFIPQMYDRIGDIPESFEVSEFYKTKMDEVENELNKYKNITLKEAEILYEEEYNKRVAKEKQHKEDNDNLLKRYRKIDSEIRKWKPPTKRHYELQTFCIKQLQSSIDFDCNNKYHISNIIKEDHEVWLMNKINKLTKDYERYSKRYKEECDRIKDTNEWIKQLRESL